MAQRWRSFLSLTLLLVSVGFLGVSYSLHAHPHRWSDSFWSSWLNLFPADQAMHMAAAWAGGFFLMGALLLLGSTALLIWGRHGRRGLFLGLFLALILGALLAGSALTHYLSHPALTTETTRAGPLPAITHSSILLSARPQSRVSGLESSRTPVPIYSGRRERTIKAQSRQWRDEHFEDDRNDVIGLYRQTRLKTNPNPPL
jgi:hypothetical protein